MWTWTVRNSAKCSPPIPGGGLSQAIVNSTGGVCGGRQRISFHPLGDHAQVSFVIDGQPISDQQSKVFSTQLPVSAIQNMEVSTGTPTADFGDKSSLIANITTRSGLGANRLFGSVDDDGGKFLRNLRWQMSSIGYGNAKMGNFLALPMACPHGGHFLDTPEFLPYHDIGNNQTVVRSLRLSTGLAVDVLHLNLFSGAQLDPDSQQPRPIATGPASARLDVEFRARISAHHQRAYVVHHQPVRPRDRFQLLRQPRRARSISPATQNQQRHSIELGREERHLREPKDITTSSTVWTSSRRRLLERFGFGITDPTFNDPRESRFFARRYCSLRSCTRGGQAVDVSLTARRTSNQYAFYVTDSFTAGNFLVQPGTRARTFYRGITSGLPDCSREPASSYNVKKTGTVLRGAFARTFETPFNENLILSSATGPAERIGRPI